MNKLTHDELRAALEEAIGFGDEGVASIIEHMIEKECEKVTSDMTDKKARRVSELLYFRMILDKLERAYSEESDIAHGGDEPKYFFG